MYDPLSGRDTEASFLTQAQDLCFPGLVAALSTLRLTWCQKVLKIDGALDVGTSQHPIKAFGGCCDHCGAGIVQGYP